MVYLNQILNAVHSSNQIVLIFGIKLFYEGSVSGIDKQSEEGVRGNRIR